MSLAVGIDNPGPTANAYTFLMTASGVRAISHLQKDADHQNYKLSLCHREGVTKYGEPSKKIKGILLQEREEISLIGRQTKKRYTWQHVAIAVTRKNEWVLKHALTFEEKQLTKSQIVLVNDKLSEDITTTLDSEPKEKKPQSKPMRFQTSIDFDANVAEQGPYIPLNVRILPGPTLNGHQ